MPSTRRKSAYGQTSDIRNRHAEVPVDFRPFHFFGGYKQSGWGYESGRAGIETYLQSKTVWTQL